MAQPASASWRRHILLWTVTTVRSKKWGDASGLWCCWFSDKATGWKIRGSNPGRDKYFLFSKTGRPALGSTHYPILWVPGFCPLCNCVGPNDHSPPSSTKVTNEWSCTSTPAICGHAVAQLAQVPHYKAEGRGFDSRWCQWNFSLT